MPDATVIPSLSDVWTQGQSVLAAVAAVVLALEVLVRVLRALVGVADRLADATSTHVDDALLANVSGWLGAWATGLEWIEKHLPRAALGKNVKSRTSVLPP